jgi:hypothetical protein
VELVEHDCFEVYRQVSFMRSIHPSQGRKMVSTKKLDLGYQMLVPLASLVEFVVI